MYTTIGCDGSIGRNNVVGYWEEHLNRIERVLENLRELGDIGINPIKSKRSKVYKCLMPKIIGIILQKMGLKPGNKTKHNPQLNREFLEAMTWEVACAFTADTIPEDGTVSAGAISCTHSMMLKSGVKDGFVQLVGKDEVKLIKKHGKREGDSWRIPIGKLKKLRDSDDSKEAQTASKLYQIVFKNPSNQIKDEKQIIESLGVKLRETPICVHYHKKTGNVTVSWRWITVGEKEAMKLAIISPPNDAKKKSILRKWLLENPDETEKMYRELRSQSIDVSRWWNDE